MKRCRSILRALRRGHYVDIWTGTYRSRKESTILRKTYEALLRREAAKEDSTDGNDSE